MFGTINLGKVTCALVSVVSMIGALAYTRGVELLVNISMIAAGAILACAVLTGAVFVVVYLITRQPVVDAGSRLVEMLKRNPKIVARFSGTVIAVFTGVFWVLSTLPDEKFKSIGIDKALVLAGASLLTSVCLAKYLRSKPQLLPEFQFKSAQWVVYPICWFAVTAVSMLLIISPK